MSQKISLTSAVHPHFSIFLGIVTFISPIILSLLVLDLLFGLMLYVAGESVQKTQVTEEPIPVELTYVNEGETVEDLV